VLSSNFSGQKKWRETVKKRENVKKWREIVKKRENVKKWRETGKNVKT
jgi:hypothetical protein